MSTGAPRALSSALRASRCARCPLSLAVRSRCGCGCAECPLRCACRTGHVSVVGATYARAGFTCNPMYYFLILFSIAANLETISFTLLSRHYHIQLRSDAPSCFFAGSVGAMAVGMRGARLGALTKRIAIAIACITTVSGTATTHGYHPLLRLIRHTFSCTHVPPTKSPG